MKRIFLNFVSLVVICFFSAIAVTFSADELSSVIFKVDTRSKDSKVKIETVVSMLKGVLEVDFNFVSKKLEVKYDPEEIDEKMIQYVIEAIGYPVTRDIQIHDTKNLNPPQESEKK